MPRYSKEALELMQKQLAESRNCPHPEDQRETLGYGIYCKLCKVRVGLLSQEEAMKKLEDAVRKVAKNE